MKRIFLAGASSFIGRTILPRLEEEYNTTALTRRELDLLDPSTFEAYDFSGSLIIDCINVNNGNSGDINSCNVKGFGKFIAYLKKNHPTVSYLYFSTVTVLSAEVCKSNAYVQSKKEAEELLKNSGLNYHIVRLSFPIGKGENPLRLTTRLINSIREDKQLNLTDVRLNITPAGCIAENITSLVDFSSPAITFLSNNLYTSLPEFAEAIGRKLNKKPVYVVTPSPVHFEPVAEKPVHCSSTYEEALDEMI